MEEKTVLCGASRYEGKYYFNPAYNNLPEDVKKELKIMCVLYVEEIGGILTLTFDETGSLQFEVATKDFDPLFDEIGSRLKIHELQKEKRDFLSAIEIFHKIFILGMSMEEVTGGNPLEES